MKNLISLRWPVLARGYQTKVVEGELCLVARESPMPHAVPSSSQRVLDLLDGQHNNLFSRFMALDAEDADAIRNFADRFGLLGIGRFASDEQELDDARRPDYQERLSDWAFHVLDFRETWQKWEDLRAGEHVMSGLEKHGIDLPRHYPSLPEPWISHPPVDQGWAERETYLLQARLNRVLEASTERCFWENGRLVRRFTCGSLMEALALQLAYAITDDTQLKFCPFCHESWPEDEGRSDQVWCNECKRQAGNRRKRARSRLRNGMTLAEAAASLGWRLEAVEELNRYHGTAARQFSKN